MKEINQRSCEDSDQPPRPHRQFRRWIGQGQYVLIAFIVVFSLIQTSNYFSLAWTDHRHNSVRKYDGEHITWEYCGENDNYELECSSINVPMDQFDGDNSSNKMFSIPLIRLRGDNATQNLLINPGGPGGSGIEYIYRAGKLLKTIAGEGFHILGFDPRGVNGSRPTALCYPDGETRLKMSRLPTSEPIRDSPAVYAWAANFAQACADTTGEHARYINTPQTAADMNSILDAVGQEYMFYWGFSYGTILGQTYATMFPQRSERVIIDGVANVFEWYETLVSQTDFLDSDNALAGFFDECIKAGQNCTLSPFADNKYDLQRRVMGFIESLRRHPVSVYLNNTAYGVLEHEAMLESLFRALHKPAEWYSLADSIAQLMRGNGAQMLSDYKLRDYYSPLMYDHNAIITSNDAISGKENWPQEEKLLKLLKPLINGSTFSYQKITGYYARAQWPVPTTHTFRPNHTVETKHPVLILSQQYDPITPLASARVAKETFRDSRLIEIEGIGHCSPAIYSTCLVKHVRKFLTHGILPEWDVKCEVDASYFIKPEEKEIILARAKDGDASDEDKLRAAQLEYSDSLHRTQKY